jgi:hypothetical protein
VARILKNIYKGLNGVKSRKELLDLIKPAADFDKPLKFEAKEYLIVGGVLIVIGVIANMLFSMVFGYPLAGHGNPSMNTLGFFLPSIPLVIGLLPIIAIFAFNEGVSHIEDRIICKMASLDYGMAENVDPNIKLWKNSFKEFARGEVSSGIEWEYRAKYRRDKNHYKYRVYKFRWTDKETKMVPTSKGISMETVEVDHYRFGIRLERGFAESILICSSAPNEVYPEVYKPSSVVFKEMFSSTGLREIDVAKFLKPAVVVMLEDLKKEIPGFNIEFSSNKEMLISFDQDILSVENIRLDFDNPKAFYERLERKIKFPVLDRAIEVASEIYRLTDNNFKKVESSEETDLI